MKPGKWDPIGKLHQMSWNKATKIQYEFAKIHLDYEYAVSENDEKKADVCRDKILDFVIVLAQRIEKLEKVMSENKYNEPWEFVADHNCGMINTKDSTIGHFLGHTSAKRAIACVNAMEGIDDPAKELSELRARIDTLEKVATALAKQLAYFTTETGDGCPDVKCKLYGKCPHGDNDDSHVCWTACATSKVNGGNWSVGKALAELEE